jgi:hypothetical protein
MNSGFHKTETLLSVTSNRVLKKVDMSDRVFGLQLGATCSCRDQPTGLKNVTLSPIEKTKAGGLRCLLNLFASAAPGKLLAW